MRKYVIGLLFLFQSIVVSSQITQGNWLVGGDLSYFKQNSRSAGTTYSIFRSLDVTASAGYFFGDKFAGGLRLNSTFSKSKDFPVVGPPYSNVGNTHGFGPFLRYYFLKPESMVNLLTDANFTYYLMANDNSGTIEVQQKGVGYAFLAGPVIFFNSSVGMALLVGYKKYTVINSGIDQNYDGPQLKIGFQFHLDK